MSANVGILADEYKSASGDAKQVKTWLIVGSVANGVLAAALLTASFGMAAPLLLTSASLSGIAIASGVGAGIATTASIVLSIYSAKYQEATNTAKTGVTDLKHAQDGVESTASQLEKLQSQPEDIVQNKVPKVAMYIDAALHQ